MKGLLALRCSGCFVRFLFHHNGPKIKSYPYCVLIVVNMWVSFPSHFNACGQYVKHIHLIAINVFLKTFNWEGVMAQAYIKL